MVHRFRSPVHGQPAPNGHPPKLQFQTLASLPKPPALTWLLDGFIPEGFLTVIQGPKGVGKTTFLAWLVARWLGGRKAGGRRRRGKPRLALWLAGEEAYDGLVAPRLKAAGVRPARVLWPSTDDGKGTRQLSFPNDWPFIERAVVSQSVGLVAFDPFSPFLAPGYSPNDEQCVRLAIAGLLALAWQHGVTFLLTQHLRKALAESKADRGLGSVALPNAARSVLQLQRSSSSPTGFALERVEGNIGRKPASRSYELQDAGGVARFVLGGELPADDDQDDDALDAASERTRFQLAVELLRKELADGEKESKTLFDIAWRWGISDRTLWRAGEPLRVVRRRVGNGKEHKCLWSLPAAAAKK